jgi:hypothetical protein
VTARVSTLTALLVPLLASAQHAPPARPFQRFDGCIYKPQRWNDGELKRGTEKSPNLFVVTALPLRDLSWQTRGEYSTHENKQDNSKMLASNGQHQPYRSRPLIRGRTRYSED